jgi:hypothetical protein
MAKDMRSFLVPRIRFSVAIGERLAQLGDHRPADAAGHTAHTASSIDATDALRFVFAAARAAESKPTEASLWQELRRVQNVLRLAEHPLVGLGPQATN